VGIATVDKKKKTLSDKRKWASRNLFTVSDFGLENKATWSELLWDPTILSGVTYVH